MLSDKPWLRLYIEGLPKQVALCNWSFKITVPQIGNLPVSQEKVAMEGEMLLYGNDGSPSQWFVDETVLIILQVE